MPSTPTMSNHGPLPSFNQIDLAPIDSFSLSTSRNQDLPLVPTPPLPVGPFPMLPVPTPKVLAPLQSPEIALGRIANEHDVASVPTIASVGTAARHVSLAAKADAAIATGTAFNPDLRLVVHSHRALSGKRSRGGLGVVDNLQKAAN